MNSQDTSEKSVVGRKDDQGKRQWHLLPWRAVQRVLDVVTWGAKKRAVEKVVDVLGYGAIKYSPDNWRRVEDPQTRYFNAAMRHLDTG